MAARLGGVTEQQRYDTLTAATDRAAAADRAPWAIIGTLLTAISSNDEVTDLAVVLLDAMTAP